MKITVPLLVASLLFACASSDSQSQNAPVLPTHDSTMNLGAFSVSLSVKDLAVSREFYAKLGFTPTAGDPSQGWQILRNGDHVIGLFQGMFEGNIMTFNPGWDQHTGTLESYTDVREIQKALKAEGVALTLEADESTTGPAHVTLIDPDGNAILIDQHVDSPSK